MQEIKPIAIADLERLTTIPIEYLHVLGHPDGTKSFAVEHGILRALDGRVSNADFTKHTEDAVKHITSDERAKWNAVVVKDVTYNSSTAELTVLYDDTTSSKINLPKENFLSAASFDPAVNKLTLTLVDGSRFDIDLTDLIDVYTAGAGLNVIDNVFSVKAKGIIISMLSEEVVNFIESKASGVNLGNSDLTQNDNVRKFLIGPRENSLIFHMDGRLDDSGMIAPHQIIMGDEDNLLTLVGLDDNNWDKDVLTIDAQGAVHKISKSELVVAPTPHSQLLGLSYAEAGHTGFEPSIGTKLSAFNVAFGTINPSMSGNVNQGVSTTVSRADHVHPIPLSTLNFTASPLTLSYNTNGYINRADGVLADSLAYKSTDYVDITPYNTGASGASTILFFRSHRSTVSCDVAFYDSSRAFISGNAANTNSVKIPSNALYFRATQHSSIPQNMLLSYDFWQWAGNLNAEGFVKTGSSNSKLLLGGGGDTSFEENPANIKMNGIVSAGMLNTVAKADHVHASDTTKLSTTGGTMTGDIIAKRISTIGTGNVLGEGGVEIRGAGSTIFPSLDFHNPALYSGHIKLTGVSYFQFLGGDGVTNANIKALSFIKSGGTSNQLLKADGSVLDFEEGRFTPTIYGSTTSGTAIYASQRGFYQRLGNKVDFSLYLQGTFSVAPTGFIRIGGLPIAATNTFAQIPGGGLIQTGYSTRSIYYNINSGTSLGFGVSSASLTEALAAAVFGTHMSATAFQMHFSGSYFITY